MAVIIKNQLYQPLPIMDNLGRIIVLKAREKRVIENLDINNLPKQIEGLKKQEFVKIKNA